MIFISHFGAMAKAAPDGQQLYARHCATCHGDTGMGGVGVPLALPSFLENVDDNFLRQTIRHGRPGRVMPSFPKLSAAQLDALVDHIRAWSAKPAPEFAATPVTGDPLHGKALFASNCAACHGENGEGGKGTGVSFSRSNDLPVNAPALNNAGFLKAASDEMIRHTLLNGHEGTPMRSHLERGLSSADINDLVVYVRSFEKQAGSSGLAKVPPDEKIITAESPYPLDETVENLKNAIVSQNFQLIRTDLLEHGLVEEGKESKQEVILHFCNFKFLYEALAIDPRVGLFLPCRVTVVEHEGKVQVMTINPLYLSHLFNNRELDQACKELHRIYIAIIEDAIL